LQGRIKHCVATYWLPFGWSCLSLAADKPQFKPGSAKLCRYYACLICRLRRAALEAGQIAEYRP
jgi:hypothetical protein